MGNWGGGGGEELSTKLLKKIEQNLQKTWRLKEDECTLYLLLIYFFPGNVRGHSVVSQILE